MDFLTRLTERINIFSDWLGRTISWCTLFMVIIMTVVVVLRYGFNLGWIWLQESVLYLHAFCLMLAMPYALKLDEHVRVDIFYRGFSPIKKNRVNLVGHLIFLLPMSLFLLAMSWNYVAQSWMIFETSQEAGGIAFVYGLKSLLIIMPLLLVLQAANQILNIIVANSKQKNTTQNQAEQEQQ